MKCEIRNVHGKKSKWHLILYGWFVSCSGMVAESATVCVCDRFKLFVNYRAFCFGLRSGRLLFYSPSCVVFRNIRWRSTHTRKCYIFNTHDLTQSHFGATPPPESIFWIKTVIFTLTNKDRPNSNRTKQDWVTGPESHQQQQSVSQPATNQRTVGTDTNLVDQNTKPSQVKVLNVDAVFTPTKLLYLRFYMRYLFIHSVSQSYRQSFAWRST